MGKGRPRAVEKGVLGQTSSSSSSQALAVPQAPVYYPTESEFEDPLSFIAKIRPEAESYGICRIVPPKSWAPPFALDLSTFSFLTKSQAIHRLQSRPAACDPATFELEYTRFFQNHCGRKRKKRSAVIVFEGEDLNLCYLFNAVKRFGGYDKVVKEKKWGDVFRFIRSDDKKKKPTKITECAKHVLCQLYREHLYDYEEYCNGLSCGNLEKDCKRKSEDGVARPRSCSSKKRRRKNGDVNIEKKVELDNLDQICEQCKSGLHGEVMLLCDRCNRGWHLYCLTPPLEKVPPGNWYCLGCVNSDKDSFGFIQGKRLLLDAFKKEAEKVKRKWLAVGGPANRAAIERRFWDIVEGSLGKVEVMYGSDLDTSVYGSGFPRENDPLPPSVEPEVWKKYCSSPWNLNNLPKLEGSMLWAVRDNIAGVMVPWLYVGMLFSSFCWHFEDHCFYSMNYLHWGEPKCWYSVPGSEAQAFEQVMRNTLPDLFDAQPDLLFQLVTMLNPSVLQEHGVPVYSVLQEPGNFVITFPRSFHGGFNFGLNCAEAVNFAPADWLPHGGIGADLYRLYHKAPVLSHEELLCVLAKGSCTSKVSPYLKEEMLRVYEKEKRCREELWRNGIIRSSPMSPHKQPEYVGTEELLNAVVDRLLLFVWSGILRKPNETMRLIISTVVGVVLGFLIGISFPPVSLTKFNFPTSLFPSIDLTYIEDRNSGLSTQALLNHAMTSASKNKNSSKQVNDTSKIYVPTNPRGAERLPPSIVVSESDFYLRRLWGKPSEDLTVEPKYLVTFTVGYDQKKNIDAAVKKFSGNFTIMLFHYDGRTSEWEEFEWSKHAIHVSARKQTKWWYAKRFLHPDIVARYDYIFIWDEDLGVEHFNAEEYIKLVKKHGLEISQPGLEPNKGLTWQMTKRRGDREVHKETEERPGWCTDPHLPPCAAFVEIMATVFSRDAWRCVWHMIQNDLVHGWGLDFALRRCVEPAHEKIGVVDAQWIVHQVVPSLGNQGKAENGKAPWEGVRERCRKEWTIFQGRMADAEKAYFKELGITPPNSTAR